MTRGIMVGFALMVGCSRGDRVDNRHAAPGDTTARMAARGDSAAQRDSGGRQDTAGVSHRAPAADPPCFASHLGLPCR